MTEVAIHNLEKCLKLVLHPTGHIHSWVLTGKGGVTYKGSVTISATVNPHF